MRSDVVVIAGIGSQNSAQMRLAQDNDVVQALAPDRSDQPLGKAILPRRGRCGRLVPDAHGAQSAVDDAAIDPIPIADEVTRSLIPRKCLRYLTCNPFGRRICCDVDPDQVSAVEPDDDEGIEQVETDSWNNEQVHGGNVRRVVIREMSIANPLWGAPRIHGELLKLGIDIGQTSVAKYMVKRRGPPSQGWKTFLHNHADGIAAMDLFVVPTISFRLLYGLLIMGHGRRQILWFDVTANPTAEWIANQVTEACGWEQAPRYLICDRDDAYGEVLIRRLRSMGIRDRPTSPRSPWQNGYAERLIGSIRGGGHD